VFDQDASRMRRAWPTGGCHTNIKTKQSKTKQKIHYKIEQSFKHLTKPNIAPNNHTQKILGAGKQPAFNSLICVLKFTLLLSAALFAFMAVSFRVLGMIFAMNATTIFPF
jgi:hypothetical protein